MPTDHKLLMIFIAGRIQERDEESEENGFCPAQSAPTAGDKKQKRQDAEFNGVRDFSQDNVPDGLETGA